MHQKYSILYAFATGGECSCQGGPWSPVKEASRAWMGHILPTCIFMAGLSWPLSVIQATAEAKKDAIAALTKYDTLTNTEDRESFMRMFKQNGDGKGPASLKFVYKFQATIEHTDEVQIASMSD